MANVVVLKLAVAYKLYNINGLYWALISQTIVDRGRGYTQQTWCINILSRSRHCAEVETQMTTMTMNSLGDVLF